MVDAADVITFLQGLVVAICSAEAKPIQVMIFVEIQYWTIPKVLALTPFSVIEGVFCSVI